MRSAAFLDCQGSLQPAYVPGERLAQLGVEVALDSRGFEPPLGHTQLRSDLRGRDLALGAQDACVMLVGWLRTERQDLADFRLATSGTVFSILLINRR